ncbi:hypothetical protein HanXRQr2_Chr11g0497241 [Helianthus annuus]|uniref:Uncharacterized protein n=1 Tax=Helianthus annuus TaxID=4232 RepID=A0A9K3N0I7_HELAN|nr:hypothetical protein HanXRQr2_Chr11g0497241 [Helianthus annuus]KAJ0875684.1 hypothetical protein HanPSC8_Chr11g0479271 [Helianthus annuus]
MDGAPGGATIGGMPGYPGLGKGASGLIPGMDIIGFPGIGIIGVGKTGRRGLSWLYAAPT